MTKQTVYRVYNPRTNIGPFQMGAVHGKLCELANDKLEELPMPIEDGLGNLHWADVFGAPSISALRKWILVASDESTNKEILDGLDDEGYVVAEFLVDRDMVKIGRSGLQCAFYPSNDVVHHQINILVE